MIRVSGALRPNLIIVQVLLALLGTVLVVPPIDAKRSRGDDPPVRLQGPLPDIYLPTPRIPHLKPTAWMLCIDNIFDFFRMIDETEFEWRGDNPCGFSTMTEEDVKTSVLFSRDSRPDVNSEFQTEAVLKGDPAQKVTDLFQMSEETWRGKSKPSKTISIAGDSTLVRFFMYTANKYLKPKKRLELEKAKLSLFPTTAYFPKNGYSLELKKNVTTELRFFRMTYVAEGGETIEKAISESKGGVVLFTLGCWDMNYRLRSMSEWIPGLITNQNETHAMESWTLHLNRFFKHLVKALRSIKKKEDRPLIIIRESFMPYCYSFRFMKRKKRRCHDILRPWITPLYRRTLHSIAWSLGIPVIPTDPLFSNNYQFCKFTDGIHLEFQCYDFVQQIVWNSVRLMQQVQQGQFGVKENRSTSPFEQGVWQEGIQGEVEDVLEMEDLFYKSPIREENDRTERRRLSKKVASEIEERKKSVRSHWQNLLRQRKNLWSIPAFFDPEVYDNWRRGFTRVTPGGVDTKAIWLNGSAASEDYRLWAKAGTQPPGGEPEWDPAGKGGLPVFNEEMKTVAGWFVNMSRTDEESPSARVPGAVDELPANPPRSSLHRPVTPLDSPTGEGVPVDPDDFDTRKESEIAPVERKTTNSDGTRIVAEYASDEGSLLKAIGLHVSWLEKHFGATPSELGCLILMLLFFCYLVITLRQQDQQLREVAV